MSEELNKMLVSYINDTISKGIQEASKKITEEVLKSLNDRDKEQAQGDIKGAVRAGFR